MGLFPGGPGRSTVGGLAGSGLRRWRRRRRGGLGRRRFLNLTPLGTEHLKLGTLTTCALLLFAMRFLGAKRFELGTLLIGKRTSISICHEWSSQKGGTVPHGQSSG